MRLEPALMVCLLVVGMVLLPALAAAWRRRQARETSAVAARLLEFATDLRRAAAPPPALDDLISARVPREARRDFIALRLASELPGVDAALVADAAQRVALRLKRRVAFERKMLARTASGRRRGAVAAATPAVLLLGLAVAGERLPVFLLVLLVALEGLGGWLLWRQARVEV